MLPHWKWKIGAYTLDYRPSWDKPRVIHAYSLVREAYTSIDEINSATVHSEHQALSSVHVFRGGSNEWSGYELRLSFFAISATQR